MMRIFMPWMAAIGLLLGSLPAVLASPLPEGTVVPAPAVLEPPPAPIWSREYSLADMGRAGDVLLLGIRNSVQLELPLRRDRVVTAATLNLEYHPSPALLAALSHLRVYLNDRLMGVLPAVGEEPLALGQPLRRQVALDARLFGDFNRLRVEFVGHYREICEDPANSALWLSIGQGSTLQLTEQALPATQDLAHFPAPLFDARDNRALELPMLFAADVPLAERQAAAILASYFGSLSDWRGARFPVLLDRLPEVALDRPPQHAVVFATNARRPALLADRQRFPDVSGPVIERVAHPESPYASLLLIRGRDSADLQRAVTALALGTPLLRGARVEVGELPALPVRRPYDAPNWAPVDRPVRLGELIDYPQQLQVSGLLPPPVTLDITLPPDLFVWRNQGIPLSTRYRFTANERGDESRLTVRINEQFIDSLPLRSREQRGALDELRLGLSDRQGSGENERLSIPSLKVGASNRLSFEFSFAASVGSSQQDRCQTVLPASVYGAIDEDSSIDLSGYHHYMAMPDLAAFAGSAYPFSRMADLSATRMLVPAEQGEASLTSLLEVFGHLGARIGYPAFAVQLFDDWAVASAEPADLLILGQWPAALQAAGVLPLQKGLADHLLAGAPPRTPLSEPQTVASTAVTLSAAAPLAAVVGLQSPLYPQHSLVALLADSDAEHHLLQEALADPARRAEIRGSLALIRSSGVVSQTVGEPYYVGELPWWWLLWFHLAAQPLWLAGVAVLVVLLGSFLIWRLLRGVARRRLEER